MHIGLGKKQPAATSLQKEADEINDGFSFQVVHPWIKMQK
jgi:hypothetical protein